MKVRSPREVAFFSAFFSSLLLTFISSLVHYMDYGYIDVISSTLILLGSLGAVYVTVYFFVERFLSGRIRVIYKTIHSLKTSDSGELKVDMTTDVLGSVNREVQVWAKDRTEEIQQLRDQEAFRREFLGNLAHELKTPVFSIQGYILTLLEGGLEDPNINLDFLERASKGVERISNIIEDLDTITNLESGRLQLNIRRFNIVELAQEIMDSLETQVMDKKRTLAFDEEYSPMYVGADKGRIGQVLTNLIANSIYYGNEGGKTEVRFTRMEDRLLVEVADDGPGISAEHLPRLFERFYRVEKSRARNVAGSGLGLAIVKHIIEAHKETINVQSKEGVGSTFSFTLRRATKAQDSKPARAINRPSGAAAPRAGNGSDA
jgi:two-component system phosphate regulon sensor histidine kinase PhoR